MTIRKQNFIRKASQGSPDDFLVQHGGLLYEPEFSDIAQGSKTYDEFIEKMKDVKIESVFN